MSKPAALPLFGDAYLADTTHLTTEEHGAYFLLLLAAWRQDDCALPDADSKLARIVGMTTRKWKAIRPTLMEFWTVENGRIYQPRLRREHDFVCKKSESNRKSANARWSKQAPENKEGVGMRSQCEGNAPPPITVAKATGTDGFNWNSAVAYLGEGKRSLVGKWRSEYGPEATMLAITAAQRADAVDPSSYIAKTLRSQRQSAEMPIC
jgi:uncharacterized protein YdaU (DUF1376 family)